MVLPVAPTELRAVDDSNGGQFTMHHIVDNHVRGKDLLVVYTNEPDLLESPIQTMKLLLAEDNYQVLGFDLKFSSSRVGQDQNVSFAQLFINNPYDNFSMVDATNDLKALDLPVLTWQNLVNICDHYKVWGSTNNKQNSLVDLASAIIAPYYMKMNDESKKDKNASYTAWDEILDE
ncbi:hypothetical protein D1007_51760 [Hordeum vulgare]|nr:hypothetical protein D1007_51760 [Hordeum vulgare]